MRESFTPRRVGYAVAALLVVFASGTVGFHESLDENWLQAFYRTVVTTSLAATTFSDSRRSSSTS